MKLATKYIQGMIAEVENASPSVFTKQDVVILLSELSDSIENDDAISDE